MLDPSFELVDPFDAADTFLLWFAAVFAIFEFASVILTAYWGNGRWLV